MTKARYRSAYASALVAAGSFFSGGAAGAEEPPPIEARMQCERAAEPGRVRCSVEIRAAESRSIAWADVAILELPDFASALKGRIGPADATARDAASVKWAFGLVARRAGQGEARARVRVVLCEPSAGGGEPACAPRSVEVSATLVVGG